MNPHAGDPFPEALEASRLARDNAAWYRLLDLAGVCDTLVADADGVYRPALFADRLLLGLMGIMAESELHVPVSYTHLTLPTICSV